MKARAASVGLAASIGLLLAVTLAPMTAAAGPTRLNQGSVSPTTGTASTSFAYSVHYIGNTTNNEAAISVTAVASNGSTTRATPLLLTTGTTLTGTWTGSGTLPAGSWTVTFQAVTSLLTNPSLSYATSIVVTGPTPSPTPTPAPTPPPTATPMPSPTATPKPTATGIPTATPRPTPKPTARPTGAPQTATPAPTPFGTIIDDPSLSPGESQSAASSGNGHASASSSPGAADPPKGGRPFNVPVEGIVAIGLLGAVTVAAALGEWRRRHAVEVFRAGLGASAGRPTATLEADAPEDAAALVDDETVATIDYEAPDPGRED